MFVSSKIPRVKHVCVASNATEGQRWTLRTRCTKKRYCKIYKTKTNETKKNTKKKRLGNVTHTLESNERSLPSMPSLCSITPSWLSGKHFKAFSTLAINIIWWHIAPLWHPSMASHLLEVQLAGEKNTSSGSLFVFASTYCIDQHF